MSQPRVSIVIPTLNAGAGLDRLLDGISEQDDGWNPEVLAVDSGSNDGTLERLRRRGVRVLEIAPSAFNHGESRNAGLAAARGELAVLIVQDAVPASRQWLSALLRPLLSDGDVAGSFARQQPWPGASRVTAHSLSGWIAAGTAARVVGPFTAAEFAAMPPARRHDACAFDNVCSCIRIAAWRQHPFRRTPIAEDLEWARDVLLSGHRLAFAPEASVWHSHDRSARYELERTYLVHQRLQALFDLSTIPGLLSLARSIAGTLPVHVRLAAGEERDRIRAMARAAALAVALPLGQYLGARSAREGRELMRTGRI
jgi:rhamnosyltransferase